MAYFAYAKAFRRVCEDEGILDLPTYYDAETKESIQSTETRVRFERQKKLDRNGIIRTVSLGLAALLVSTAGLVKLDDPQPSISVAPELIWFARIVAEHPLAIIAILFSTIYFSRVLWTGESMPERSATSRMVQALLQPYGRGTNIILRALASLLLIGIGLALVIWRIKG